MVLYVYLKKKLNRFIIEIKSVSFYKLLFLLHLVSFIITCAVTALHQNLKYEFNITMG